MSGSWNAYDRQEARRHACKGEYRPVVYQVRVDDDFSQWRYQVAARALGIEEVPGFLIWCIEYVIRHARLLKGARRTIRQVEAELRKKRRRERAYQKARKV